MAISNGKTTSSLYYNGPLTIPISLNTTVCCVLCWCTCKYQQYLPNAFRVTIYRVSCVDFSEMGTCIFEWITIKQITVLINGRQILLGKSLLIIFLEFTEDFI